MPIFQLPIFQPSNLQPPKYITHHLGILEQQPYGVRGLVGFGANLLLSHADSRRGRKALKALDFYVHADFFMNPIAELADVVLPVASAFETQALKIGFEVSPEAQSLVQLRQPVVDPRGEARSDTEIVFALTSRLGLGAHFWDGDVEVAYRYQLGPSGVSLQELRDQPGGVRLPQQERYRKFAGRQDGANFNLIIGNDAIDPISGSVPHRAYLCDIRPVA